MIEKNYWGSIENKSILLYKLNNKNGFSVWITNYGSTIVSILYPNDDGSKTDIVLGFDNLEAYSKDHPYFGSTVGRYANRISNAKFTIDNISYQLPINNGKNCLHGGVNGFHKAVWDCEIVGDKLCTKLISPHGSEGFPGNLSVRVDYLLNNENQLIISYSAYTDKKTHVNFTDHTYFNLSGGKSDILDHQLTIEADFITPTNQNGIPTGDFMPVENTPFDFRNPKYIGNNMKMDHYLINRSNGFDHNFVLKNDGRLAKVASIYHGETERQVTVYTTEPGIQLYTGNGLGTIRGKQGMIYKNYFGLCLETQHFPDSPNQAQFPSTLLSPGEWFKSTTIYQFGF
jgi:aldose 1-epimerase